MIGSVFKILGLSLILMLLLDATLMVVDTINVHNRVQDVESVLRYELSKYNSIPDEIAETLDEELRDIVANSSVAWGYKWNWKSTVTSKGKTYPPINEANVRDYGEQIEYIIKLDMRITRLDVKGDRITMDSNTYEAEDQGYGYISVYKDIVPALRYLK